MTPSKLTRHLRRAERALEHVRQSLCMAEQQPDAPDLSEAWRAMKPLSLVLQAERFKAEDLDEAKP